MAEPTPPHAEPAAPSDWVARYARLVPPGGRVLDVAAGGGRHTRLFLGLGHPVTAVDRTLAGLAADSGLERVQADLESASWPLPGLRFAGIVVTNYLHRPLLPILAASLTENGVLIYETFALGNEAFGRPSNPDFLLKPNELIEAFAPTLTIVAYEHGVVETPKRAMVQRVVGQRARAV
jgi:SAM-dependent methyltransferase